MTYKLMLPPEVLALALRECVNPADFEPHIGTLLEKAPLSMLSQLATQIRDEAALPLGQPKARAKARESGLKSQGPMQSATTFLRASERLLRAHCRLTNAESERVHPAYC